MPGRDDGWPVRRAIASAMVLHRAGSSSARVDSAKTDDRVVESFASFEMPSW
jgi:hypothetical protein